jgi:hypothetical protein
MSELEDVLDGIAHILAGDEKYWRMIAERADAALKNIARIKAENDNQPKAEAQAKANNKEEVNQ